VFPFLTSFSGNGGTKFSKKGNGVFISPELTGKVVPKNSHGSEMRYYVHPAIATYEMIFA
jgi:hypothetical protein